MVTFIAQAFRAIDPHSVLSEVEDSPECVVDSIVMKCWDLSLFE